MQLIKIIGGAVMVTAMTFLLFQFSHGRPTSPDLNQEEIDALERQRAKAITMTVGEYLIRAFQICGGLAATLPIFGLLMIISGVSSMPDIFNLFLYVGASLIGWMIFGWCNRIIDALSDE